MPVGKSHSLSLDLNHSPATPRRHGSLSWNSESADRNRMNGGSFPGRVFVFDGCGPSQTGRIGRRCLSWRSQTLTLPLRQGGAVLRSYSLGRGSMRSARATVLGGLASAFWSLKRFPSRKSWGLPAVFGLSSLPCVCSTMGGACLRVASVLCLPLDRDEGNFDHPLPGGAELIHDIVGDAAVPH